MSEREFQIERGGQWMKGKGCPTFGPLGPWLVTPDEIARRAEARHVARRQRRADADRLDRDHDLQRQTLVSYISQFMILEPGDVITTGTPPGVGMGKKPPRFLKAGDTMSLGIDGLGRQAQRVVAWTGGVSEADATAPVLDRPRASRRSTRSRSSALYVDYLDAPGPGSPTCRWCWPPCPSRSSCGR